MLFGGLIAGLEEQQKTGCDLQARQAPSIFCVVCAIFSAQLLPGEQDSQFPSLSNSLCAVVDSEFSVDIAGVHLDCVQ